MSNIPVDSNVIHEPARDVPVIASFDVVVVGGGIAGCAAALAAKRAGASVALIEKQCVLGGLATSGLIAIYLPICDGYGHQVAGGLAEELIWLTERCAPVKGLDAWRDGGDVSLRPQQRFISYYPACPYILALETLLLENGVEIYYDNRFVAANQNDAGAIDAVIVENASGRGAITCRAAVDASGDMLLARAVNEPTNRHANNRRAGWFFMAGETAAPELIQNHIWFGDAPEDEPDFVGDNHEDVRQFLLKSRPLIMQRVEKLRTERNDPTLYADLIAFMPQFRVTRTLAGEFELDESHCGQWFDDAIGMVSDWRQPRGFTYALPYRIIRATRVPNLMTAGRGVSATRPGAEITRVIPTCSVTGEAAGLAAVMSINAGRSVQELDVSALQKKLTDNGVILNPDLLKEPAE